jgi:hypothetical protein
MYQRDDQGTLFWGENKVNYTADLIVFGLTDQPIPNEDPSSDTSALGSVIGGNFLHQNRTSPTMHFDVVARNLDKFLPESFPSKIMFILQPIEKN